MPAQVNLAVRDGRDWFARSDVRHDLLNRIGRGCGRHDVTWLAWGMSDTCLRLVLDGGDQGRMVRGFKVGTSAWAKARGAELRFYTWDRVEIREASLCRAVAWAHRADGPPLGSPWSSHRDMLGLRMSGYFDAEPLNSRVGALEVHSLAGGGPLPRPAKVLARDLGELLEVTAGVRGCEPGDPSAFGLFVAMGREQGWRTRDLARALDLTPRRVRQLAHQPQAEWMPLARQALADPRLRRVR